MSWLFDRLCEIAVADEVEIVVSAKVDDPDDLGEVLVRAANVPQLTIVLAPAAEVPTVRFGRVVQSIDIEDVGYAHAVETAVAAIGKYSPAADTALRVRGNIIASHEICSDQVRAFDDEARRVVLITDAPGFGVHLRAAGRLGLGISVGGVDPEAQVRVAHAAGAISIIDALVALRTFAFGGDRDNDVLTEETIDVRRRCRQAESYARAM